MASTTAYYLTANPADPSEPTRHYVTVVAIPGYQPVILDGGRSTYAGSFKRALFVMHEDCKGWDLVAEANGYSGLGESRTKAEMVGEFTGFFEA